MNEPVAIPSHLRGFAALQRNLQATARWSCIPPHLRVQAQAYLVTVLGLSLDDVRVLENVGVAQQLMPEQVIADLRSAHSRCFDPSNVRRRRTSYPLHKHPSWPTLQETARKDLAEFLRTTVPHWRTTIAAPDTDPDHVVVLQDRLAKSETALLAFANKLAPSYILGASNV
jgi:hypothetical protein